ncbi:MAG: GatB/YqeY domain-containing protein [Candidatus Eremiobacteraeota bacterium]|nr:GatB/YqeY domain-containing protein [Candidatus Eremiobacteraeota bacterium]
MGSLKDRIANDLKEAMRARDQLRLDTLRSAISGFTYRRTEAGADLSDADELAVVTKLVKQRNDSLAEYEKAARTDLAEKERAERDILMAYMPKQKSADDVRVMVRDILAGMPTEGRNQGSVMKVVMPQLKGVADGNLVRQIVMEELG